MAAAEQTLEEIFQLHRWPHYRLLLDDMRALGDKYRDAKVLSIERSFGMPSRWQGTFANLAVSDWERGPTATDPSWYSSWDLIIVPNLLHHMPDVGAFLTWLVGLRARETYIFDSCFRELHYLPRHYHMLTPYGIRAMLAARGMHRVVVKETGNRWEALKYCLDFMETEYGDQVLLSDHERARINAKAKEGAPDRGRGVGDGKRMCLAWSAAFEQGS